MCVPFIWIYLSIAFIIKNQYIENKCKNEIKTPLQVCIGDSSTSHSFLVTEETYLCCRLCSGWTGVFVRITRFGCNVWLQCLDIWGVIDTCWNKDGPSARSVHLKTFPNRGLERETKNIFLCWKHFTNYFIGVKKKNQ